MHFCNLAAYSHLSVWRIGPHCLRNFSAIFRLLTVNSSASTLKPPFQIWIFNISMCFKMTFWFSSNEWLWTYNFLYGHNAVQVTFIVSGQQVQIEVRKSSGFAFGKLLLTRSNLFDENFICLWIKSNIHIELVYGYNESRVLNLTEREANKAPTTKTNKQMEFIFDSLKIHKKISQFKCGNSKSSKKTDVKCTICLQFIYQIMWNVSENR